MIDSVKVSIVMCTYNGEKYIEEQLSSICHQSVLPDEIIIGDDGSTDNTLKIVMGFKEKYPQIKWIINVSNQNLGFKKNFITTAKRAEGDILFFSDQDDIWDSNKIETMTKVFDTNPSCLALTCSVTLFDGEKK